MQVRHLQHRRLDGPHYPGQLSGDLEGPLRGGIEWCTVRLRLHQAHFFSCMQHAASETLRDSDDFKIHLRRVGTFHADRGGAFFVIWSSDNANNTV